MSAKLPGDASLPPGVSDSQTEARALTPSESTTCIDCDGDGAFLHGSHWYVCKQCDGWGQIVEEPSIDDEIDRRKLDRHFGDQHAEGKP